MNFTTLDLPNLTFLFIATVFGLGIGFVWMFCELERRILQRRRPAPARGRR